jgi:ATP-dependent RNA helicase MSS116
MGIQVMTHVQAQTYHAAFNGTSIMAQSKTGSGKTIAFLLPSIQRLLERDYTLYKPGKSIGIIIVAPTRELVIQITDQAETLLKYHPTLNVISLYGGVKLKRDIRLLTDGQATPKLPSIVVSTPGRLLEHLETNTRIGRRKCVDIVDETQIVVLDETDRLFENHQRDILKILSFLKRASKRQTLLYSATFPPHIRKELKSTILKNVETVVEIDCLEQTTTTTADQQQQSSSPTTKYPSTDSSRIEQTYVILKDMSQYVPILLSTLRREIQQNKDDYKIIVFFPAGRLVRFLYQFLRLGGIRIDDHGSTNDNNLWEIHSRMSQSSRMRSSAQFRTAKKGILLSSDVSARGLDYPDVTLVLQLGAPYNDEQYIHRIGRTGRAGRKGKGILVLLPFEALSSPIIKGGKDLQLDEELTSWINEDTHQSPLSSSTSSSPYLFEKSRADIESTRSKVRSGHAVLTPGSEAAFKAFLAHYISTMTSLSSPASSSSLKNSKRSKKMQPKQVLEYAEDFAAGIGLADIPELDPTVAARMGL